MTYAYDRQSQRTRLTDQNGTTRDFEYDGLGRKTADVVATLGAGVDDAVRRIGWTYEVRGMVEKVTSYSDAAGTSIENEIANVYNGFAQLVTQYQQHDGAVVTLSSPKVQYAYADGSANTIRATSLTYPDGAVLEYRYDDEAADALSRVRTLRFDSMDVCRYDHLGLGTFVRADYLEPQVRLDYATGSGSNPYAGFDRFSRVVDQLWRNYDSATDVVRIKHGYDRSSNRLYREDAVAASFGKAFDELYRYDGLDRLVDFARGNLVDGNRAIESPDWSQDWTLDAVGNWNGFEQRVVDDPTKWLDQQRVTNRANEIAEISRTVGAEWATPAYDANGNMASLPRWNAPATSCRATWDAWNRLAKLEEPDGSGWQDLQEHAYDGSNRRILRKNYASGTLSETRRYLYSDRWQALEEGVFDGSAFDPERQYVYGQRYIDDVVLRDRDSDLGGSFDERFYAMQDANWNVVALCDADADVQRRYTYLPYGEDAGYEGDFAPHSGPNYLWTRRFASYEFDIDVELCLARNRWYDPRLGSWISRDPLVTDVNHFRYVLASPLGKLDPSGLITRASAAPPTRSKTAFNYVQKWKFRLDAKAREKIVVVQRISVNISGIDLTGVDVLDYYEVLGFVDKDDDVVRLPTSTHPMRMDSEDTWNAENINPNTPIQRATVVQTGRAYALCWEKVYKQFIMGSDLENEALKYPPWALQYKVQLTRTKLGTWTAGGYYAQKRFSITDAVEIEAQDARLEAVYPEQGGKGTKLMINGVVVP